MSGIAELRWIHRKIVVHSGNSDVGELEYMSDPILQTRVSGGAWVDVPTVDLGDEILDTTDS